MTAEEGFESAVSRVIAAIPVGDVMTYGEVAAEAGFPGAARAVGTHLRRTDDELPWWRVVPASGLLVAHLAIEQAARLRSEGTEVRDGRVVVRRAGRSG